MRKEYLSYLSLVRAALWGGQMSWPVELTEPLLALNAYQGTGPLVYPYVLSQENMPAPARMHMKSVCMSTMQNQVSLHFTLEKAWNALQQAGIRAVLMKGAGLAALYPEPHYRTWGDIDLYVGKDQYHPACAAMRDTFPGALKFDEELDHYKHYNLIADGVSIEVHRVSIDLQHPRDKRYYAQVEREGMMHTEPLMLNGLEVQVPEPTFNVLFVFFHSLEHLMSQGVNLRQICDLALLLHRYAEKIDAKRLKAWLQALHLTDMWALYVYVMHYYLGLPKEEALFFRADVATRAERMTEDLLSGRLKEQKSEEQAPKGRVRRKFHTMQIRVANAHRVGQYSPAYARHMIVTTLLHGALRFFAKDRHWE